MLRPPRHPQPPHRSRRIGLPDLAETAPTGSRSAKTRRPPCRIPFRQNRPQSGTRPVRFRSPPNRPEDFRRYGCPAVCEYPSRKCSEKIRPSPLPPPQTCPRSRYRILRPPCGSSRQAASASTPGPECRKRSGICRRRERPRLSNHVLERQFL